jgi:hypothetical protein
MAPVSSLVDAVVGEAAGEHPRNGVAPEAVRDEVVRVVRHRDDDVAAPAGGVALEQSRDDLRDGTERTGREVGDLDGRPRRRGVPENAGPAEVVEIVSSPLLVTVAEAEAGDRAVDGAFRGVLRADAEPGGHAGPERLEYDVRLAQELERRLGVALQIDFERLLPHSQRGVPSGSAASHRIAAGRLDADDARPELQ